MLIAARSTTGTDEDYIGRDGSENRRHPSSTPSRKAVESVEDPVHEMTLAEARRISPQAEIGSEVRIQKSTEALGRISAQTAKQVIFQKVAKPSGKPCTRNTPGAPASCELHHQARGGAGLRSGPRARPKPSWPRRSSRAWKATAWATASGA